MVCRKIRNVETLVPFVRRNLNIEKSSWQLSKENEHETKLFVSVNSYAVAINVNPGRSEADLGHLPEVHI